MPIPLVQSTGRRKEAIARVRFHAGEGKITINGRDVTDYFPSDTDRMVLSEPLRLTETEAVVRHRRHHRRRRHHRPGRRPAPRHRPRPHRARPRAARPAEAGRVPQPGRPGQGVQEVRPQEGPQGSAVLEALTPVAGHPARPAHEVAMSLKFGTDGVRGVANSELTPELALALGRAAARIIGGTEWLRRPRHPPVGSAPRRRVRRRRLLRGRRRGRPRRPADAGRGAGLGRRRPARGDDLGVAQPVRRQRHQAVRVGRAQARATRSRSSWRPSWPVSSPTATATRPDRSATGSDGSAASRGRGRRLPATT